MTPEAQLRSAVAAESFHEAARLLEMWVAEAERQARTLDPGSPAFRELRAHIDGVLGWAAARIGAFRACAASESARLQSLHSYDAWTPPPGGGSTA
jgi:hypothetical protein